MEPFDGLSDATLDDLLSDGVEYSCAQYWGRVLQYQWRDWPNRADDDTLCFIREDNGGDPDEADTAPNAWTLITRAALRRALKRAAAEYPDLYKFYLDGSGGYDLDYDVVGADVVLQFYVLGRVVYG
jgi:hypothetical protein